MLLPDDELPWTEVIQQVNDIGSRRGMLTCRKSNATCKKFSDLRILPLDKRHIAVSILAGDLYNVKSSVPILIPVLHNLWRRISRGLCVVLVAPLHLCQIEDLQAMHSRVLRQSVCHKRVSTSDGKHLPVTHYPTSISNFASALTHQGELRRLTCDKIEGSAQDSRLETI